MFLAYRYLFFILFFTFEYSYCTSPPKVELNEGVIRGKHFKTVVGRDAFAFLGVPYAAPPVGENRFEPPKPVKPWTGEFDATIQSDRCIQLWHVNYTLSGDEDCLYLDIYTPKLPDGKNFQPMDVVVYIHGGAFQFGSGIVKRGDYLISYHDIVYVSINYRLGPFGFLSTGDDVVPGNMGLKDQSKALSWIKNNIAKFGGNPNSITITGMSAGGASVHYHYLSPMSKGLFQRGVSMSGCTLVSWAQPRNVIQKSKHLASLLGCPTCCSEKMIKCLKSRPAWKIVNYVKEFMPWLYNPYSPFGPVVEPPGEDRFITEKPLDIIRAGKVQNIPWLISVTSHEGLYPAADFIYDEKLMKELNDNWNNVAPHLFDYSYQVPPEQMDEVSQSIRDYLLKDEVLSNQNYDELVQVLGNRLFTNYIEFAIREQAAANSNPIYYYKFSYRGKYSLSSVYAHNTEDYGVSHGDDTMYTLKVFYGHPHDNPQDKLMLDIMQNVWKSFASTGKPAVSGIIWPQVPKNAESTGIPYVHFYSPNDIKLESVSDTSEFDFWNSTLNEYPAKKTARDEL